MFVEHVVVVAAASFVPTMVQTVFSCRASAFSIMLCDSRMAVPRQSSVPLLDKPGAEKSADGQNERRRPRS